MKTINRIPNFDNFLIELSELTEANEHTERLIREAEICENSDLLRLCKLIGQIHEIEGHMPISQYRLAVHERVYDAIEQAHGKEVRNLIYNA